MDTEQPPTPPDPRCAALLQPFVPRVRRFALRHLRSRHAAEALLRQVLAVTADQWQSGALAEPRQLPGFVLAACRLALVDCRLGLLRGDDDPLLRRHAAWLDAATGRRTRRAPVPDADAVAARLQHLPARERAVVLLSCWDGSCASAVGLQLACPPQHVRALRHQGYERLARTGPARPPEAGHAGARSTEGAL